MPRHSDVASDPLAAAHATRAVLWWLASAGHAAKSKSRYGRFVLLLLPFKKFH